MARLQLGRSHRQIEGTFVPVADMVLAAGPASVAARARRAVVGPGILSVENGAFRDAGCGRPMALPAGRPHWRIGSMPRPPAAFLSYVREDDENAGGGITDLRKRLEAEIRLVTGLDFTIFHDRQIGWGEAWEERIDQALDASTFFIPILTPRFVTSPYCRDELSKFLGREEQLRRSDLILPIYYSDEPVINDPALRAADPLAAELARRQLVDWRDLRFQEQSSLEIKKLLASMAQQVRAALGRPQNGPVAGRAEPAAAAGGKSQPQPRPGRQEAAAAPKASAAPSNEEGQKMESADARAEASPQAEPPTLIVDPESPDRFATIAEAVTAARPGERILVRPGRYDEGIVLDKPLEIQGDGRIEEIVVRASGSPVVQSSTLRGRIVNLSLRQLGGGDFNAVLVTQGRLEIEGCDITSQALACVAIQRGAEALLTHNHIHNGKTEGVHLMDGGRATLEDNEILASGANGVQLDKGSISLLRRNLIHSGKASGIVIEGRCTLEEENDIYANAGCGVIAKGANPAVTRNTIHHNLRTGIWITEDAQGSFGENDINANGGVGIDVDHASSPTIRGNQIHDNKSNGIWFHGQGQGTVENNKIFGNIGAEIAIVEGSNPTVRLNDVFNGKGIGIFLDGGARARIDDNKIFRNATSGLHIAGDSHPIVRRNQITGNMLHGVVVASGGGTFQDNQLGDNKPTSWDIAAANEKSVIRVGKN